MAAPTRKLTVTQRRERFRGWLEGDELIPGPNVWDPLSAAMAEDLGFEWGLLSGHVVSWMVTGGTDRGTETITEYQAVARRIIQTSNLSLMVTGDFGFGNALNYMRAVEELESAGVSCLCIPDCEVPLTPRGVEAFSKRHDVNDVQQYPIERVAGMIEASLEARVDPTLLIAARTNVLHVADAREAVRRVRAYEEAGVEAIWLTSAHHWEGFEAVHAATDLPLIVGGAVYVYGDRDYRVNDPEIQEYLLAQGVRLVSISNAHYRAGLITMYDTLKAIRDGELTGKEMGIYVGLDERPAWERLTDLAREPQYDEFRKRFIRE